MKKMQAPAPAWLPNWRNTNEYPDPVTATYQQWAWEFLRRNKKYQADYKEIAAFQQSDDPEINRWAVEAINKIYGQVQFVQSSPSPVSVIIRNLLYPLHTNKGVFPWVPEACWRIVTDYNLRYPLDPARSCGADALADAFVEGDILPAIETDRIIIHPRSIPKNRRLTITLEKGDSLVQQLDYARGFILAAANKKQHNRKSEYLDFLRILDGKAVSAPWNAIAKAVVKDRSSYDKASKKAATLRDSEFFKLSQFKYIPGKGVRFKQGQADGEAFKEVNNTDLDTLPSGINVISSKGINIHIKPRK